MDFDHDRAGYDSTHHLTPTTGCDYDAVSRNLGEAPPAMPARRAEVIDATTEALHKILDWLVLPGRDFSSRNVRSVGRKTLILAWTLEHSSVARFPLRRLSAIAGCSKQALSKLAVRLTDEFPIHARGMKSRRARSAYSEAQKRKHWRRRVKTGAESGG
jgi:hypothetical protein